MQSKTYERVRYEVVYSVARDKGKAEGSTKKTTGAKQEEITEKRVVKRFRTLAEAEKQYAIVAALGAKLVKFEEKITQTILQPADEIAIPARREGITAYDLAGELMRYGGRGRGD